VGLAAVYLVLGKLSLLSAVHPGYASAIFPPSGIALASLLLWGNYLWVGVWLGGLFLNLAVQLGTSAPLWKTLVLSVTLASSCCLESFTGTLLIRRFVRQSISLVTGKDVILFLILGGPVSALLSSSLGASSLLISGEIPHRAFFITWSHWFAGDCIGVFIFSPLMFAFFGQPRNLWSPRIFSVVLPMSLTFVIYTILVSQKTSNEKKSMELEIKRATCDWTAKVRNKFDGYLNCLYGLETVILASYPSYEEAVKNSAQGWLSIYPGVYDFSWSPRVRNADRSQFEQKMQKRGFVGYQISDLDERSRKPIRAPIRPEYFPTEIVVPYRRQENVPEFDSTQNPERFAAMSLARDTGKSTAAGPLRLIQQKSDRTAVIIFHPVYKKASATQEDRRRNLIGFLKVIFPIEDVIRAATVGTNENRFYFSLSDALTPDDPIYAEKVQAEEINEVDQGEEAPHPIEHRIEIEFAGRRFFVQALPRPSYWWNHSTGSSVVLLGTSLILNGILGGFFLTLTGSFFITNRALTERTQFANELSRSNADLEQFAYVASHDLREPLRTISSHLQLVSKYLSGQIPPNVAELIGFAVDGAKRMEVLINDLLQYARVGRSNVKRELVNVEDLIKRTIMDLKACIGNCRAEIHYGEMPRVFMVPMEANLLFQNIIGNALKYYHPDRRPKIEITAHRENDTWQISVRDNGVGIPSQSIDRIFMLFQRLPSTDKRPGTGIGLAICKRVVEAHGGRIWVESVPEEGSVFNFTLPAA
jgi:signal transduction histidine kinase